MKVSEVRRDMHLMESDFVKPFVNEEILFNNLKSKYESQIQWNTEYLDKFGLQNKTEKELMDL
jgi:hypothetical protein